jgi:hypothetical protein
MNMAKHTDGISPAFTASLDRSKSLKKKYAKDSRDNHTDPLRLLTEKDAISLRKDRMTSFLNKASDAIDRRSKGSSKLSKSEKRVTAAMLGNLSPKEGIFPLASNPVSRVIFFDAMYQQLKSLHAEPGLKMYFVTIVDAKWCLARDATSFDTLSMMRRAKRALRDIGYDGVLILEIQAVISLPDIRFMPHMHGFIWRRGDQTMGPDKAAHLLNKRFSGIHKAKGVSIAVMKQELPDTLSNRFHYATKLPDRVSGLCRVTGDDKAGVTSADNKGTLKKGANRNYTKSDALELLACWPSIRWIKLCSRLAKEPRSARLRQKFLLLRW